MQSRIIAFFVILIIFLAVIIAGASWYAKISRHPAPKVAAAPETSVTVIDGWDNSQIANLLEQKNIIAAPDFLALEKSFDSSGYPLLASKPASADLEGFLFPDTYQAYTPTADVSSSTAATELIKKMLDNFSLKFTPQMQVQAQSDNMSVYEIVTLASIIQKESGGNINDKKTIAGIFYNRLQQGIPLQSDATVSFVTGRPDVSTQDEQINSPYNTFKYPGLPAGPICNPGLDSLTAALYPTKTNYLYFLTDPKTGQAIFAQTYQQQLQNKQEYLGD